MKIASKYMGVILCVTVSVFLLSGALPVKAAGTGKPSFSVTTGHLNVGQTESVVGGRVPFEGSSLKPNAPVNLKWMAVKGGYQIEGVYNFIQPQYTEQEMVVASGMTDAQGNWSGTLAVPEGFGGDHTLFLSQDNKNVAQTTLFVRPTFRISPASGPIGSEITIQAQGIGYSSMESNWQLTYDNKMTGLLSAVATNGTATAKIRAAGPVGKHTLTIWHGYLGMPYMNYTEAPTAYLPVPTFTFEVTDGNPVRKQEVEPVPPSAGGGDVAMPALQMNKGVQVSLNQTAGTVGEKVTLSATGIPANKPVEVIWHTMEGSRVSGQGFTETTSVLGQAQTGTQGELQYAFPIPDDLGGPPHRIDLKIGDQIVGGAYLKINPSIVKMTPSSGPAGTPIEIQLKGVGWTEYDNAYYLDYDNAYTGYMCGFNSQGTVTFTVIASGEPGYHLIDLYPGIYRGKKQNPNIYVSPQLTYEKDHPGSTIPAIRLGFDITE